MQIRAVLVLSAAAFVIWGRDLPPASAVGPRTAREMRLTNPERRTWNTYFTNFSEVYMEPFEQGKITDDALIEFGIRHNLANNDRLWKNQRLAARYVDDSVMKFFGRRIRHHYAPSFIYPYKDGYYGYPRAEGESPAFSQITSLRAVSGNEFQASLNVFIAGEGWEGDPLSPMSEWRRGDPDVVPRLWKRMRATVRKVVTDGKSRYILLDYRDVK